MCACLRCAPHVYWITSLARRSREEGIVIPSALAVLRLRTNSNCIGCCTGRSAGLAPCRILATYVGGTAGLIRQVVCVAHEATELHEFCMSIHDGQAEGVDKLDDPFPVVIQETVMCDNERLGTHGTRGPEGLCHIVQVLYLQGLDVHTQHAGGGFDCVEIGRSRGAGVLIREVADPRDVWERLFQQFQALPGEFLRDVDEAGDIVSRVC